ncbi:MAG: TIGR03936 family radical SAM-associated protein, partial [Anaerolineales bacterium]
SHLDMQKIWERALRRARLPLTYSQGFHPQPRLNQACPLPLGVTSRDEIIDIWLNCDSLSVIEILNTLQKTLPDGIRIHQINEIPLNEPPPDRLVIAAEYEITLFEALPPHELERRVAKLVSVESIIRIRREKQYDLRPLILNISIIEEANQPIHRLRLHLSARPGATGRADEVLSALGLDATSARIERTRLILERDASVG